MSDESPDTSTGRDDAAPGAAAGDAAHTTQIPRIERPGSGQGSSTSAKTSTGSKPKSSPGTSPDVSPGASSGGRPVSETDKGRPRTTATSPVLKSAAANTPAATNPAAKAPAAKAPAAKTPAAKTPAAKTPAAKAPAAKKSGPPISAPKPSGGPAGRPLTASDYARTTSQSPSTTAVIPAVKPERSESPVKTAAPTTTKTKTKTKTNTATRPETTGREVQMSDPRGGRAATLRLSYIEPWSVTRMAFAISVAMMVVAVVAVAIFWLVLEATGVWDQIDGSVTSVLSDDSSSFRITDYLGFTRLVGLSLVLSALNVVIATVLATIAAHLYNLAAQLLGGVQVTYTSED